MNFERKLCWQLYLSILATGLMSFTGVVVETAMNVTFPTLMKEFSVSMSTVQWITTGYLLVLAIVIPSSAFLKKRFHTKKLFLCANIIFLCGTILGAVAPNFYLLLLGRLLQGAGTGIALPLMFNIVLEQAPLDKMGMMMGAATLVVALAPAVGPSIGGMIVNDFGWRMIFVTLTPVLIISLLCGIFAIRQSSELETAILQKVDYLFMALTFTFFILGSSFAGNFGWTSPEVLSLFMGSLVFLTIFCRRSLNSPQPFIHLFPFKNIIFSIHVVGLIILQFICLGLGFLIPNFAQIVLRENPFSQAAYFCRAVFWERCLRQSAEDYLTNSARFVRF